MGAPKGNQFWKARSRHGRRPKFESAKQLEEMCEDYFCWVEDNPLIEHKAFAFQGEITIAEVPKMRAMTIQSLCLFLGCSDETWMLYRDKEDFSGIISDVEKVIYDQKFSGASANLLNANIIARDLGLSDKKDLISSDKSMTPVVMTADEYKKARSEMIDNDNC